MFEGPGQGDRGPGRVYRSRSPGAQQSPHQQAHTNTFDNMPRFECTQALHLYTNKSFLIYIHMYMREEPGKAETMTLSHGEILKCILCI